MIGFEKIILIDIISKLLPKNLHFDRIKLYLSSRQWFSNGEGSNFAI